MNAEKSCLDPMQVGQWLGFIIGTIRMQFRILDKKTSKLKATFDVMIFSGTLWQELLGS